MATLDDPGLDRLWDALAARLERNGLATTGTLTLSDLTRPERFALAGLIGRPVEGERLRIDLGTLDARIRVTGRAPGLVSATEARRGPLVDRPGRRAERAARRTAVWAAVREELARNGLAAEPWVEPWIESIRSLVARLPAGQAGETVATSVRCLARLPWDGPRRGRTELASSVAGDSHALDDGSILSTLVLRAVAARTHAAIPVLAAERRRLWEEAGVSTDEVSTTVLTLGLQPSGPSPVAEVVRRRSQAGYESHVTLRDLRRAGSWGQPAELVWVCENPRVLEAVMDARHAGTGVGAGSGAAVVCTAGNPTVVVMALLARLAQDGADLRYRGDFDWAGVAIANRVMAAVGAGPWRMERADYEDALAAAGRGLADLPPLEGRPVAAAWSAELTAAMERAGRVVHEELLLDLLVADVLRGAGTTGGRSESDDRHRRPIR